MNWNRAKTILIILFLLSDLFLLGNIIASTRKLTAVTPEIIESTINILKNNNISIDSTIIPKNVLSAPYAEADNVIYDFDAFSKAFLGEDAEKTEEYSYKAEAGTIHFSGDSFTYKSTTPYEPVNTDEKNARITAIDFLKSKGFDLSDAEIHTNKSTNGFTFTFNNKAGSLPLFNSVISAKVSGTDVTEVWGTWFNVTNTKGQENELKSVTSALIDFIPLAKNIPTKVTGLCLGYTIPDSTLYHKSATLIPVWEIKEENGTVHYPDARNPE